MTRCPGSGNPALQAPVYGQTSYAYHCSWCGAEAPSSHGVTLLHSTFYTQIWEPIDGMIVRRLSDDKLFRLHEGNSPVRWQLHCVDTDAHRYTFVVDDLCLDFRPDNKSHDALAIDIEHLEHQREWSAKTFGPGINTLGVIDHIRKELLEIEADPTDLKEWVDVIILAFDGAWRAGWEPGQVIAAVKAKQVVNENRKWPDWRTAPANKAIEHIPNFHTTKGDGANVSNASFQGGLLVGSGLPGEPDVPPPTKLRGGEDDD